MIQCKDRNVVDSLPQTKRQCQQCQYCKLKLLILNRWNGIAAPNLIQKAKFKTHLIFLGPRFQNVCKLSLVCAKLKNLRYFFSSVVPPRMVCLRTHWLRLFKPNTKRNSNPQCLDNVLTLCCNCCQQN